MNTNKGHTPSVHRHDIEKVPVKPTKFSIGFPNKNSATKTCNHLRSPFQPYIAPVPVTQDDFKKDCEPLSTAHLSDLARPQSLSYEQQEIMSYHLRFGHLPFFILCRIAKIGLIPKRLTKLKDVLPRCPECLFVQAHYCPWHCKRTKDDKTSSIRKDSDNAPRATISINRVTTSQWAPHSSPYVGCNHVR